MSKTRCKEVNCIVFRRLADIQMSAFDLQGAAHAMRDAEAIVADLFQRYFDHPADLPPDWLPADGPVAECEADRFRRIRNFIAGMTDRYALNEHQRLFDSTPELR